MRKLLPLSVAALLFATISNSQAVSPYTNCPDVNIAIARAGTNGDDLNPYYLYNVNNASGAMTQVTGGPFKDPLNPTKNLQVNGIGISKKDGFIYGLTNQSTVTTSRFLRLDKNYGVTNIGSIPSPTSAGATVGVVNSAAGDVDTAGNYYFTGATVNVGANTLDKLFIGKIANIQSYTSGAGAISVSYYEIDITGANCSAFINSLSADPLNSGLRDFSYNAYTKSFFTYVTFKPAGAANFTGQLLELKPIPGSMPLKYQLVCSGTTNTHAAEVNGTLIDKLGRFTVLFTDGSFAVMTKSSGGAYTGAITTIASNAVTTLPNPLRGDMASCGQQTVPGFPMFPVTNCPNASFIVARAGFNADTQNPYFIYTVNTTTGVPTLIPGPGLLYPANPSRTLQVNGVGLNTADGFFYGVAFEGTTNTAEFVRFDRMYGTQTLGGIVPPTSSTGFLGFVNTAAGDVDRSNNYFFTGFTANPAFTPSGMALDKLFLGRISSISNLPVAGNPAPQYFEIDYSDANCAGYISTFNTDPSNSGLKDLVFNPFSNSFITYVTFKPTGAANFTGQIVELKPIANSVPLKYKMTCRPVTNTHTAEVSGTLIDNSGNFIVLLTDGTIGKLVSPASFEYSGIYAALNNATGLPAPLRGDMASCSGPTNAPLPVRLSNFTVAGKDCSNSFSWTAENEVDFSRYELEQSTDNVIYTSVSTVAARKNVAQTAYKITLPNAGKQVYYRLKLIDLNGNFAYSRTLNVLSNCSGKFGFVVNPNPVSRQLNINWYGVSSNTTIDLMIFNASGGVVSRVNKNIPEGTSTIQLQLGNLPAGAYWIKAIDVKGGASYQTNFVKQ